MDSQTQTIPQGTTGDIILPVPAKEGGNQEPVQKTESKIVVEETTNKNETEVAGQPGTEVDQKRQSQIIQEQGESRKKILESLITLARTNETAASQVKKLIAEDPAVDRLVKTKFGDDYDSYKAPIQTPQIDIKKIEEEAMVRAQADVLLKQLHENKAKQVQSKSEMLGFNTEDHAKFQHYVDILEKSEGLETALEKAAILANQAKATASQPKNLPSSSMGYAEAPKPDMAGGEVKISRGLYDYASVIGKDPVTLAKSINVVQSLSSQSENPRHLNGVFNLPPIKETN